jgi:hypothetical protein
MSKTCTVPPAGWVCTREAGHLGPCAAIQATYLNLASDTPLTEALIKKLKFEFEDYGDEPPYEMWEKDGIKIWNFNDEHWLVNMLDQEGIDREFHTLGELDLFFRACGKTALFKAK